MAIAARRKPPLCEVCNTRLYRDGTHEEKKIKAWVVVFCDCCPSGVQVALVHVSSCM
jgi:hypothetical protein